MTRQDQPGGWYCDVTVAGHWVVLVTDQHLLMNGAVVPLPKGQNVLQVRISPNGQKCAGTGHQDDLAWQWDGHEWTSHGRAWGIRACLFDNDNRLLTISGPDSAAGSQGMRYISDQGYVIYSDETYADPERGIWEYTERGDATIGQGGDSRHGDDPCIGIVEGVKHVIEDGRCRFINAYRAGDRFTLAYVRADINRAVLCWFTRAELVGLPIFEALPPVVIDPPPIEVDPPPIVIDPPPIVVTPPPPTHVLKGRTVR